jgi:hypothetical protein
MNACCQLLTIVRDHWFHLLPALRKQLPAVVAAAAIIAMTKALTCRTDARGFIQYRCLDCGAMLRIPFACKSRWCPHCGIAKATEAAERAKSRLLNVRHRHLTFSVPAELRHLLFVRRELLAVVAKAAVQTTIQAMGTRCRAFAPLPGVMATVHTYGRNLEWHVHVHVLCTEGGLRGDGVWQPVKLYPATQYRRLWQYWLLKLLRAAVKGDRSGMWHIGHLYHTHPTGFIVNVMSRYSSGAKAAAYCCRYTGRPPLSERRIVAYDGKHVSLCYKDYRDGQEKTLTLPAVTFLVRVLQHVWPRYQRDVHYHGLYQPSRRKLHLRAVVAASRYGDQVRPLPPVSRQERQRQAGAEPHCTVCGGRLTIEIVQFPSKRPYALDLPGPPGMALQLSLSM